MENFLSLLMQSVFFLCGPLLVFGLTVFLCRRLFIALVGYGQKGRRILLAAFALSTPFRELGHAFMAALFCHSVDDVLLLDVHAPEGELGFVEHSYNPRNPIALLGNFAYALGPLIFGLGVVYLIFLICFGGAMPDLIAEVREIGANDGELREYLLAALAFVGSLFSGGGIVAKLIGTVLILALCMGAFVSISELSDSLSGLFIFSGLAAAFSFVLLLFDGRVQRVVLDALRGFAAVVSALNLVLLIAVGVWLVVAAVWFLIRFFFGTDEQCTALQPYTGETDDAF